ncbi:HNH endonuclease [Streptomyces huasconensis]|uniref:HNH endonuclease n=1 Tax=Streptomyces huasconensis TaxID=1854574 RepID=UPI003702FC7C
MHTNVMEGLPDWRDESNGGLVRGALWLLQVIGIGNVFTKSQLREAFPDISQIDRRVRDLRDWGWVIDTSREDGSLRQSEQRFVKPGISVWDPAERKKRTRAASASTRQAALERAKFACELCGRPAGHPSGTRLHLTRRIPLAMGGDDGLENLTVLCSDCSAARDSGHGVSELAAQASSLPMRDRTRLLTWITMGERPRTPVEDIWAQYQQLSSADQQQLARHLARLLNEDTQVEDAMP